MTLKKEVGYLFNLPFADMQDVLITCYYTIRDKEVTSQCRFNTSLTYEQVPV